MAQRLSYWLVFGLFLLTGIATTATAQTIKICPMYPYANVGGVTYYYSLQCDGMSPDPDAYVSWAGPPNLMTTGCDGSCQSVMATRGAKKKSNHYDADESVKKDGAKSYSGSVQYGTFSNYTLSTLEIDGLQILPFDAQIKKGANSLPIRVFPFQIIPKDATLYKRTFAIALHLDKTVNPPQSDWPEATIQHEEKQQIHFSVPLADTGFFIEGQVITHK